MHNFIGKKYKKTTILAAFLLYKSKVDVALSLLAQDDCCA